MGQESNKVSETKEAPKAKEETAKEETAKDEYGLGVTEGRFVLQIIADAVAEKYFPNEQTGKTAGDLMAWVGFYPDGGWHPEEELTLERLQTAYRRLLIDELEQNKDNQSAKKTDAESGDEMDPEPDDKAAAAKEKEAELAVIEKRVMNASLDDIVADVVVILKERLKSIDNERSPISPTGAVWHW